MTAFHERIEQPMKDKKIVLENGREFFGHGFGADCERTA